MICFFHLSYGVCISIKSKPEARHPGPGAGHPRPEACHPGPGASQTGLGAGHPGPGAGHPGQERKDKATYYMRVRSLHLDPHWNVWSAVECSNHLTRPVTTISTYSMCVSYHELWCVHEAAKYMQTHILCGGRLCGTLVS